MLRISNKEIIDVVKYSDDKVIIVEKVLLGDFSSYKPNYFVIDLNSGDKEVITKNAYLMIKFGSSYESIIAAVNNYAECESMILPSKNVLVVFPNGQAGVFDSDGEIKWNGTLKYNDSIVNGLAADGEYFWACCKGQNCVIRYTAENAKIDIRIGSANAETFVNPEFVSQDDEYIYVCCNSSNVRRIDKSNFVVSDVGSVVPGLKRYYKFGNTSILCTASGAYMDNGK